MVWNAFKLILIFLYFFTIHLIFSEVISGLGGLIFRMMKAKSEQSALLFRNKVPEILEPFTLPQKTERFTRYPTQARFDVF